MTEGGPGGDRKAPRSIQMLRKIAVKKGKIYE